MKRYLGQSRMSIMILNANEHRISHVEPAAFSALRRFAQLHRRPRSKLEAPIFKFVS